jgi:dTDP-4-dehydrorhamnose 3,5-epimerase
MIRLPTELPGLVRIAPDVHGDERGFFVETYRADELAALGIRDTFVQDNHARSTRGVLRGLHFQTGAGQAKLVRAAREPSGM